MVWLAEWLHPDGITCKRCKKITPQSLTPFASAIVLVAICSGIAVALYPETTTPKTQETKHIDQRGLDECLAKAQAYYDEDIADWECRLGGRAPKPGAVDPFARAQAELDGDRYQYHLYLR